MSQKRIALDVRDDLVSGLVVMVTFPTPWGTTKTVDVAVPDDFARRLMAKVEELLQARKRAALPPAGGAHAAERAT